MGSYGDRCRRCGASGFRGLCDFCDEEQARLHGQRHRRLLRNVARCDKCGDTIESTHHHDFKWCSCRSLAVDGGLSYTKRCFTPGSKWTELSEYGPPGG